MTVKRISKGFTLVEILIVVVILGILAAIVIPQFTNASETAKSSSVISQLQTIRSQLELYQVQHNGSYPTMAQLWGNFTAKSDAAGTIGVDPLLFPYGPYMQQAPSNPFTANATNTSLNAAAGVGVAWVYDEATGSIKACVPKTIYDKLFVGNTTDVVSEE